MVFASILAGGSGSRMGSTDLPKQFLPLGDKPILVHTVERFLVHSSFEKVIVLCPETWISHTKKMLEKALPEREMQRIAVIAGGKDRNGTIMNAIQYLESHFELSEDSVLVTHDAVRPFVTHRIIKENIETAQKYGACNTVIKATDTIVVSEDNETVTSIPNRSHMYQGQTPQSFRINQLKDAYLSLSEEEKATLTDAAKIMVLQGEKVHLVEGETFNIKITYPYDLRLAQSLLKGEE